MTTTDRRRPRILLGVTGSVAAVKSPEIAVRLHRDLNADVRILLTSGGDNFWNKAQDYDGTAWNEFRELSPPVRIYSPQEEWEGWDRLGDPVLHIDLRDWADLVVIAPLSAHTLAKISNGLCDDTLSCVLRAWDLGYGTRPAKPLVLAPAMNTAMWIHPITTQQLKTITDLSNQTTVVPPQEKALACGEIGNGALAPVDIIVQHVRQSLNH
uniref:Flavoprotein domain-containing protein n=1 Tax=Cyclophora tenuis TaxID=216820 RepID=A0A7S1D871_CYCTE|mmetsp:Transcript_3535/g.6018  ORF Transcript_3535/g.6018 Transcript_3535/m.6018 type:complete len:211 (+) Transcript_3535:3-635(+)